MGAVEVISLLNTVLAMLRDTGIEYRDIAKLFARADAEGRVLNDEDLAFLQTKARVDLSALRNTVAKKKATMKVPPAP